MIFTIDDIQKYMNKEDEQPYHDNLINAILDMANEHLHKEDRFILCFDASCFRPYFFDREKQENIYITDITGAILWGDIRDFLNETFNNEKQPKKQSCETCTEYHPYDEEAIAMAKESGEELEGWGVCHYQGTMFHKDSLCKKYEKNKGE